MGESVLPRMVTVFPETSSSVSQTRSGRALEISSIRRTGPFWLVFSELMSWILASRLAFFSSYSLTSSMMDFRRSASRRALTISSSSWLRRESSVNPMITT